TTVDMHRTGAALGGVAAHVGSGKFQVFAKCLDQQCVGGDVKLNELAVHGELNLHTWCLRCGMSCVHRATRFTLFVTFLNSACQPRVCAGGPFSRPANGWRGGCVPAASGWFVQSVRNR